MKTINEKTETWNDHESRFVGEELSDWWGTDEDIAIACGCVPLHKFLEQGEALTNTLPIGEEYFASTNFG